MYLDSSTGNIGIGTASPEASLDILNGQSMALQLGGDSGADSLTNSTRKFARIGGHHYTNAEEPVGIAVVDSSSSYSYLTLGGGSGSVNNATHVRIAASSATNSANGADFRMIIDANSRISLSNNDSGGTGGADSTSGNTIFGYLSSTAISSGGTNNATFGHKSGTALSVGDGNTAIGARALITEDAGQYAVAVGTDALYSQNVGTGDSGNVAVGVASGYYNVTGVNNTYIGRSSGLGASGESNSNNVAVGQSSLLAITTGSGNVAIGSTSGDALTTGQENVVIGKNAMGAATTQSYCTLIGVNAGASINNNDANQTVAVGINALTSLTEGQYNTAVGTNSLDELPTGSYNTAVGYQALHQLDGGETNNTAIGYLAGANADGNGEGTFVGANTSLGTATDNDNVIIGESATGGGANSIVIGADATGQSANSVTLGNASVTDVYMSQDSGAYVHSQNVPNHVANTMSSPYYRFDGSNDEIAIADNDHMSFGDGTSDNQFSISAWIYMEEASDFQIFNKGTYNSDGEYRFECSGSDKLSLLLFDESGASTFERATTTATIPENKWVHVCATYNGVGGASANGGITLYLNGVSEALSLDGNGTYVAMESLASEVRIGNSADSTYSRGSIQNLKIWNKELTATEIKDDYSGASVPFKYKGANQTALLTGNDSTLGGGNNWGFAYLSGSNVNNTVAGKMYLLGNGNADYTYISNKVTKGKAYNWSLKARLNTGSSTAIRIGSVGVSGCYSEFTPTGTEQTFSGTFVAGGTELQLGLSTSLDGIAFEIDDITLTLAGAVAEYDGSSAGALKWGDKSGNDLHGTVSGATLENTPYDSGTEYEEGYHEPTLTGGGTTGTITLLSGSNTLSYTKVGRQVTVNGLLGIDSVSGSPSGTVNITIPYVIADLTDVSGRFIGNAMVLATTNDNINQQGLVGIEGDAFVKIYRTNANNLESDVAEELGGDEYIYVGFTYFTA